MIKKTLFIAAVFALCFCTFEAEAMRINLASTTNLEDNVPTGYEAIVLQGKLSFSTGPDDIVAGFSRNSVYLRFNQSFGNVNVLIYNSAGSLVYSNTVDTSMLPTLIIPITGNDNGTYLIEINNANGYAEGEFEKKSNP